MRRCKHRALALWLVQARELALLPLALLGLPSWHPCLYLLLLFLFARRQASFHFTSRISYNVVPLWHQM